jgi:hypothetical protein
MTTRYAWLQKHPTPAARAGEFHWYPAEGDRDVRASFAEHLPSATANIVMWQLAPDHVAWALPFVAIAPLDGRRYTGLALAIADRLGELVPPIAAPWTEATARPPPDGGAGSFASPPVLPDLAGVARALLDGGNAAVGDPTHAGLPRAVAAIERVMPAAMRIRRGTWTAGDGSCKADRVAELAVAAATAPGSRAARAWQLARELVTPVRDLDAVVAACVAVEPAWITTLNAWGRGKLARDLDELADRVALRALARLAADRDPAWAIAEARWHALLPANRRTELLTAVARRADSLKAIIDEPGLPRRGSAADG